MSKRKKGVSTVIATILMIVVVISLISIIWPIVTNLINKKIKESESCFGVFDKVAINDLYTCYDSDNEEFQFSINVGDAELGELVVSIGADEKTQIFNLKNSEEKIANIKNYGDDDYTSKVKLPEKNAGLTYVAAGFSKKPNALKIAPIINGEQCDISDTSYEFDDCKSLA